ncbi:PKD domain-containing protein [Sulfuritalea sp.]|uniref:PKD domain-containing protein n=1 Tax=Sulfuritalea sp. TaxID=2480090 RepID=UPI00286E02B9|nr:PKD domain-containing protein [Sulfuritalea sp.]
MNRIASSAILICASMVSFFSVAAEQKPSASIVAEAVHTTRPPRIVAFRAQTTGLTPPLHFHWSLGNGKEWDKQFVPEQFYEPGRYDVVLTVSDAADHVVKASMAIDTESHGCGF